MDLFIEIIFRGLIINIIGLYSRYYFFLLIGKKRELKYLEGAGSTNKSHNVSQEMLNGIVGLTIFCLSSVLIAWLIFR